MALKERVEAGNQAITTLRRGAPEAWLKRKEKSSAVCTKCVTGTGSAQLLAEEAVERTEGPWIHKADTASAVKEFTL